MDSLRERLAQTWHAMASRSTSNSNQAQAAVESSGEPSIDDLEVSTMSIRQNVNAAKSEADPHQPGAHARGQQHEVSAHCHGRISQVCIHSAALIYTTTTAVEVTEAIQGGGSLRENTFF